MNLPAAVSSQLTLRSAAKTRAVTPGREFLVRLLNGKRSLAGMPGLIPDAGPGWETALLLPVPDAEPAVGRHRARLVESARDGVPAHITGPVPVPTAQP